MGGGKAPKVKAGPLEKQQVSQLSEMERLFGPVRQWMTGQGMGSLMGGRNPFSQSPNPWAERSTLDHVNTLRGLQGAYNDAYGNLGGLGGQLLGGAMQASTMGGPNLPQPGSPELGRFQGGMDQLIGPLLGARNSIIGGALPQALEAFNPHLNTAAMQALAGQGQQARASINEKSPMRGGQLASALNDAYSQEAMAKSALTYQAGQEARNNALMTLGPEAMGSQLGQLESNRFAPEMDIFRTNAGMWGQQYGTDASLQNANAQRMTQLGMAGMPWIEQGQLGPLGTTRDLSADVMGLISGLYGGAEDQGINRALALLGGSAFPNANAQMGQGANLAAMEAQRRSANAQAKGSKKGGIGSGLGTLAGAYFGGPMGASLGGKLGGAAGGGGSMNGLLSMGGPSSGQGGASPLGGWRMY